MIRLWTVLQNSRCAAVAAVGIAVSGLLAGGSAFASEEAREPVSTATAEAEKAADGLVSLVDVPVPDAFSKVAPESVDDLRAMESHTRMVIQRVQESVVGIQVGRAQGSGVIVSPDGLILTCAHVVGRPGRRCTIILNDGTRLRGETLGGNRTLDAGLARVNPDSLAGRTLPWADMANLSSVEAGNWCIALGHPGGFDKKRGIVTRFGRVIFANPQAVRTDCELVGGDSGGPLFDVQGRVIGINSRIQEPTTANYHVPINVFRAGWDRMLAGESFASDGTAFLGISGDPHDLGLKVTHVWSGESADLAGVKVGDVLLTFDSRKVTSIDVLRRLVRRKAAGESVQLELLRDGEPLTIEVQLRYRANGPAGN